MNSLGVKPFVYWLYDDLADGMVLLQVRLFLVVITLSSLCIVFFSAFRQSVSWFCRLEESESASLQGSGQNEETGELQLRRANCEKL